MESEENTGVNKLIVKRRQEMESEENTGVNKLMIDEEDADGHGQ